MDPCSSGLTSGRAARTAEEERQPSAEVDQEVDGQSQHTGTGQQVNAEGDHSIYIPLSELPMTFTPSAAESSPAGTSAVDSESLPDDDMAQEPAATPPGADKVTFSFKPADDIDALEDGLFSDDMQTYMASAQGVTASVGELPVLRLNPKSPEFVKRVASRLAKDREAFRRILARLVDDTNKECQVATADMLYRLVCEGLLSLVAPSDLIHMVEAIWAVVGVDLASKGVLVEFRGEVKSLVAFQLIETLPTDKPLAPVDVVAYARVFVMRCGLESALKVAPDAATELQNGFLMNNKATIRHLLDITRNSKQIGVASEAAALLMKLYATKPSAPAATAVELCSMFVKSLQLPWNGQAEQPEGVASLFTVLLEATQLWSTGKEEWSVVRSALGSHVYLHFDGLVDLITRCDPSTYTRWAASLTLGTFIYASLLLCTKKRKGNDNAAVATIFEIEHQGVDKVLASAPMPMEPLRRLVLDTAAREGVLAAASLDNAHEAAGTLIAISLLIPARQMIDVGKAASLIESGFPSTLVALLDICECIKLSVTLCLICLKSLVARDRKVSETDGLAKALCGVLPKEARGQLIYPLKSAAFFRDDDHASAINILKGLVRSLVGKTGHNPFTRQILQLESVRTMRDPKSNLKISPKVAAFFDSLAQQDKRDKRDSKSKATQPSMSDAQLVSRDREAQRKADELIEEERREKATKTKKNNNDKAKKGKAPESAMEPSGPSPTAASTRSSSAVVEEDVEPPTASSSIADTSVPSVAPAADGGQRERLIEPTANEESDDNNGDSDDMLIKSAFGQHARQKTSDSHKAKSGRPGFLKEGVAPTPHPLPLPPSRPSITATEKGQRRRGNLRLPTASSSLPATEHQNHRTNTSTNKKQMAAPPRFGQGALAPFAKGMITPKPPHGSGSGLMARGPPAVPKRPSPPPVSVESGGGGAGSCLMSLFSDESHPPPRPLSPPPCPTLPSPQELKTVNTAGLADQQQQQQQKAFEDEWPSLSASYSSADPAPSSSQPPANPHSSHAVDRPSPVSQDGPFSSDLDGIPPLPPDPPPPLSPPGSTAPLPLLSPLRGSPDVPAAAAAVAGGPSSSSADPFHDDDDNDGGDDDDMHVPPPPPIFEWEEDEDSGYHPPAPAAPAAAATSSSSASIPSAANGSSEGQVDMYHLMLQMQLEMQAMRQQLAQMSGQQSSQQPPSSSSSAPPPPAPAPAPPTTQSQPSGQCCACYGEHGPGSFGFVPCRHLCLCAHCHQQYKARHDQKVARVQQRNRTRGKKDKPLPLPQYRCPYCNGDAVHSDTLPNLRQWVEQIHTIDEDDEG
ncbi:unnamed protein product [Vitrella brassicaformis CCMP3155]|uniref:Uncharacterized protein n=1 Tax=Vitrella brassicaformis (strain CCMP3155) TaxID=1169540 RepID=A0A0G4GG09_VITBC|nr:unnamed protein product [Vitrella brassicaformis CCMP3155]|eukprot:CEM28493.1 unnamed protein product [Vitrella brassicaformis CCMP3155]